MKKLYEEKNIEMIVAKIRSLVPSLWEYPFSTANISWGITQVYEQGKLDGIPEGRKKGRQEGFSEGYSSGYSVALNSIPRAEGRGF
jgi:hypothetical protein